MLAGRIGIPRWLVGCLILLPLIGARQGGSTKNQDSSLQQEYLRLVQEREQISQNLRILEQEVGLSKGKQLYWVVDFRSKQILFKTHGLLLKRIPVFDVRKLGSPNCATGMAILEKVNKPKTLRISSPEGSEAMDVVDVFDMPQAYGLGFRSTDRSIALSIRPVPSTLLARIWRHISEAFQSGSGAVMQALGFRQSSYRLWLLPGEAQALYWAAEEDIPALIVCD